MIKKVKGGYKIFHCHGGKGAIKATPHPVSLKKAKSIHRAIAISKQLRGKFGK
jgi:hypothetical protein